MQGLAFGICASWDLVTTCNWADNPTFKWGNLSRLIRPIISSY